MIQHEAANGYLCVSVDLNTVQYGTSTINGIQIKLKSFVSREQHVRGVWAGSGEVFWVSERDLCRYHRHGSRTRERHQGRLLTTSNRILLTFPSFPVKYLRYAIFLQFRLCAVLIYTTSYYNFRKVIMFSTIGAISTWIDEYVGKRTNSSRICHFLSEVIRRKRTVCSGGSL